MGRIKLSNFHEKRFPNESNEYRTARNTLLQAEMALRKNIEEVAALRRELPLGGEVKEDYIFGRDSESLNDSASLHSIRFSELFFGNRNTLAIYSLMYGPKMEKACPSCTSILDGLNGSALHIKQKINFVVVAKSPMQRIREWAKVRGWENLHLLSSENNTYNLDYFAETEDGSQMPMLNIFLKKNNGIFHTYSTELLYAPTEDGQEPRHVDSLWPIWNMFDLTPEGRGNDWHPKLEY